MIQRDPDKVRIWKILVIARDVSEEIFLNTISRRLNTYIMVPPKFDPICEATAGTGMLRDRCSKSWENSTGKPDPDI
jgi:hypothetical protein